MPVFVNNSSILKLNRIYYQYQLNPPRFQSSDGRYQIYLITKNNIKVWILADTNPMNTCYYIHYYECPFNAKYHQMLEFVRHPPIIGWNNIAAPDDTVTIQYSNINKNATNQIKICIYAKQIVIKPKHIINDGYLLVNSNNKICEVGSKNKLLSSKIDDNVQIFKCDTLCPGFVDIHIHGLGGSDNVLWYWENPKYTCSRLPKYGCTSFCASVVFANKYVDKTVKMVQNILGPIIGKDVGYGAIIEGIHSEGPIIADIGGLPDSKDCNKWSIEKFELFVDSLMPFVNIMTISPSIDHKLKLKRIKFLKKRGIVPALGHDKQCSEQQIIDTLLLDSDSDNTDEFSFYNEIKEYGKTYVHQHDKDNEKKYGSCHMTHVFNVMKFHHRNIGLANYAITPTLPNSDKYKQIIKKKSMPTIEIIGDLVHVSPIVIQAILECHKPDYFDRIVFITDGIAEPVPNKELIYTDLRVKVDEYGRYLVTCDDAILCGSCCDMFTTFKNLINVFNVNIFAFSNALCWIYCFAYFLISVINFGINSCGQLNPISLNTYF
eukprot:5652_1